MKHIKGISIESTKAFDITPIGRCTELTYLSINSGIAKTSEIDLSALPLKRFVGKDDPRLKSIYKNKTLNRITISNYKYADLTQFEMDTIEHITIDGSRSLQSLKGIEHLPNLKLVEIERCPNLKRPTLYLNDYPFLRIYINGNMQS